MLAAGYVLGDLTPDEMAELEQIVDTDPEWQDELYAMQASFEVVPQGLVTVEPPPHLLDNILSAHAEQNEVAQQRWTSKSLLRLIAGMAAIASLLLITDNLRLRRQLQFARQVDPDRVASILQQPNSRLISLTGNATNTTEAAGTLLFTPGNWQEVVVSLGNLPPLEPEQIYRMWLSLENGTVIYCGEFNTDQDGSVFVRFTPLESPPEGVGATELFVTVGASADAPEPSGLRVMEGVI
ncbi:MAG: anti-sigma factor [Cyanobacteria bacterium J06626_14]